MAVNLSPTHKEDHGQKPRMKEEASKFNSSQDTNNREVNTEQDKGPMRGTSPTWSACNGYTLTNRSKTMKGTPQTRNAYT